MSTKSSVKLAIGLVAAAAVAGAVFGVTVILGAFDKSVVDASVAAPLTKEEIASLAPRGQYLVRAADCFACHTTASGPALAGGVGLSTPVGVVHATNITPDPQTGIGGWSRAEFHRALRDGVGKGGRHLYPAMPYDAYRQMSDGDVDAIYAFLMTREPISQENKPNTLVFPFSVRPLLAFWKLVNLPSEMSEEETSRSPQWNRGRYVAEALGHCGTCHTPRNLTLGSDPGRYLQGSVIEGMEAPDITPDGLTKLGFNSADLQTLMKSGVAPQGALTGQMFEVLHFSTQYLDDADLAAMAAYLFDEKQVQQATHEPAHLDPAAALQGRRVYAMACAGCHGREGEGIPHVSVPMKTNSSLRLASPNNFLKTVVHGLPEQRLPGLERFQPMPGFSDRLSDDEIAALSNWMRATWGGNPPTIDAKGVAAARNREPS